MLGADWFNIILIPLFFFFGLLARLHINESTLNSIEKARVVRATPLRWNASVLRIHQWPTLGPKIAQSRLKSPKVALSHRKSLVYSLYINSKLCNIVYFHFSLFIYS